MPSMPLRACLFLCAILLASFAAAQPKQPAVKPTVVTYQKQDAVLGEVAAELSKSRAGVAVTVEGAAMKAKCPVALSGTPFWEVLEQVAAKTQTRLAVRDDGSAVVLAPLGNKPPTISSVWGPFRVVAREVTGRALLEEGTVAHTVHLTAHWEPRMPVYRIDNHPKVTEAKDDRGRNLTVSPRASRDHPVGSMHDKLTVEQITGLTRDSKRIAVLSGEFRVVVAERMLAVPFGNLAGKFPVEQTVGGVKVTLKRFEKEDDVWHAELALEYPTNHPEFESFEAQKWLRDTRLQLVSPAAKPIDPASQESGLPLGRFAEVTYRFKVAGDPRGKGWSLVCHTPGPLAEVTVPFTLKDIPIP
jgi:hypothetical protein